jgi:hypothetical protein
VPLVSLPTRGRRRLECLGWLLAGILFCLALGVRLRAQTPQATPGTTVSPWEKYFDANAPEPAFRFPVAHDHGLGSWARFCSGYLTITHNEIQYEVLRPAENRGHAFRVPRSSLLEAGKWRGLGPAAAAEFKFPGGKVYHFYLVYPKTLDKDPHTLLTGKDVLDWPPVVEVAMGFDDVVAEIQRWRAASATPTAAPGAETTQAGQATATAKALASAKSAQTASTQGPQVRIMEPQIADASVPVEITQPTLALRGTAIDPLGVFAVTVDDEPAELRASGDIRAMEFSAEGVKLHPGLNQVTVVATNIEKQSAQLTVLLWLRAQSAAPAEKQVTTPAAASAGASAAQKALDQDQILELLRNDVASERVADLVNERGIDFEPSDDYFESLRKVGAQEVLIQSLRKAKRVKPASTTEH